MRHQGLRACALVGVLALAGCELVLVDESEKDFTVDAGGRCTSMCAGECVDLRSDPDHCGDCGTTCMSDERCVGSVCTGDVTCARGLEACGSECVDTETSATHCGDCFRPCDGDCMGGVCTGLWCEPGELLCPDEGCVDPTSTAHCGSCGNICDPGDPCVGGSCRPDECGGTGEVHCDVDVGCQDLQTSNEHCGGCYEPCDGVCVAGVCGAACDPGLTGCGAAGCVDLSSGFRNCGACGTVCDPGVQCVGGSCDCGGDLSEACGVCASLHNSNHCAGTCGNACSSTERCDGTRCIALPEPSFAGCNRDGSWCPPTPLRIVPDPLVGGGLVNRLGFDSIHQCPDDLTPAVARVACRQLGYVDGRLATGDASGVRGLGVAYAYTCTGTETYLGYCAGAFSPSCRYDDVVIVCDEGP